MDTSALNFLPKRGMGMSAKTRWFRLLVVAVVLLSSLLGPVSLRAASVRKGGLGVDVISAADSGLLQNLNQEGYQNYYNSYSQRYAAVAMGTDTLRLTAKDAVADSTTTAKVQTLPKFEGYNDVIKWTDQGTIAFSFDVATQARYNIRILYQPIETGAKTILVTPHINGKLPFREAEQLELLSIWQDTSKIKVNAIGNQMRPMQAEKRIFRSQVIGDVEGIYDTFNFYFPKGKNTLSLECLRGSMYIASVELTTVPGAPSHAEYLKSLQGKAAAPAGTHLMVQAEEPLYKSDPSLYPIFDRSSPMTSPTDVYKMMLNTMGGYNWRKANQYISWKISVPADGLYKIGIKERQNLFMSMFTTRKFTLDGVAPFHEVSTLKFNYNSDWQVMCPSDASGKPYLFYLTKGDHEIQLQVALGDDAKKTISVLKDIIMKLNYAYRRMVMVTGVSVDIYRSYELDKEIPGLLDLFKVVAGELSAESKRINRITGKNSTEGAIMDRTVEQLLSFVEEPYVIPERMGDYKNNIDALAGWMQRMQDQTLEIDYFEICSPDVAFNRTQANFFENVGFQWGQFASSFSQDYNLFDDANKSKKSVTVWAVGGRDQAQILRDLIDRDFMGQHNMTVNLKLVQTDLISAMIAGKGPDVVLQMGRGIPINYAMRGALLPLDDMPGFADVQKQFMPGAFVPYEYQGPKDTVKHTYGIPITESFFVTFYRTDVFESMNLKVPQTWDELQEIIPILQHANMQMGLPYGGLDANQAMGAGMGAQNIFPMLLMQNGGKVYTDNLQRTRLTEPAAVKAFEKWTSYYDEYGFPQFFDGYTRFRSGEMPILMAGYSFYNNLSTLAPEIRGLWKMAPILGTRRADGTIDRTQGGTGSACGIVSTCKNKDNAWEFLKWWADAKTQGDFSAEIENLLGAVMRPQPAAVDAVKRLPWNVSDRNLILESWKEVKEIPEIVGGYITPRCLDNAFRSVINNKENPREMIFRYMKTADEEIARKRKEFGLPVDKNNGKTNASQQ